MASVDHELSSASLARWRASGLCRCALLQVLRGGRHRRRYARRLFRLVRCRRRASSLVHLNCTCGRWPLRLGRPPAALCASRRHREHDVLSIGASLCGRRDLARRAPLCLRHHSWQRGCAHDVETVVLQLPCLCLFGEFAAPQHSASKGLRCITTRCRSAGCAGGSRWGHAAAWHALGGAASEDAVALRTWQPACAA